MVSGIVSASRERRTQHHRALFSAGHPHLQQRAGCAPPSACTAEPSLKLSASATPPATAALSGSPTRKVIWMSLCCASRRRNSATTCAGGAWCLKRTSWAQDSGGWLRCHGTASVGVHVGGKQMPEWLELCASGRTEGGVVVASWRMRLAGECGVNACATSVGTLRGRRSPLISASRHPTCTPSSAAWIQLTVWLAKLPALSFGDGSKGTRALTR